MKQNEVITVLGSLVAGGALLLAPAAWAQHSAKNQTQNGQSNSQSQNGGSSQAQQFMQQAARGGMMEVQLGQLATQKGANEAVRTFGQRMVQDHGKANQQLQTLASQEGFALPTQLSQDMEQNVQKLQSATGKNFDQEYARLMVKDHKKDIKEFRKAAKQLQDPQARTFAQQTLPILEQHLQLAENMQKQVSNEQ